MNELLTDLQHQPDQEVLGLVLGKEALGALFYSGVNTQSYDIQMLS